VCHWLCEIFNITSQSRHLQFFTIACLVSTTSTGLLHSLEECCSLGSAFSVGFVTASIVEIGDLSSVSAETYYFLTLLVDADISSEPLFARDPFSSNSPPCGALRLQAHGNRIIGIPIPDLALASDNVVSNMPSAICHSRPFVNAQT
jgi:hypothetical protein